MTSDRDQENLKDPQTFGQPLPGSMHIRQGAYLPHWTRDGGINSVTFRLADSLPKSVLLQYEAELENLLDGLKKQSMEVTPLEIQRHYSVHREKVERYLDSGAGACWMKRPEIAKVVAEALQHFDNERYILHAWCIMPNHVHVVVQPLGGFTLEGIVHSWKSFTASKVNKILGRTGVFWQPEPYDHLIRDEQDFLHAIEYTVANPEKAGLVNWPWVGRRGERAEAPVEQA